jgi:predicted DNA-binding transcriptional regulator YafY
MAILLELQARGELRAADLADRFEVSIRTIYRDLEGLAEGGVPLVATPGKGYRLMDGYFLPPLSFSSTEAGLLILGGEFIRDRVDPELRSSASDALDKLQGVLPSEHRATVKQWRNELAFPRARRIDDDHLGTLREAIENRRVVRLTYHAYRRPAAEQRDVEPISLIFMAESWHLAAYCRSRAAPRFFRLNRIDALHLLKERFAIDERHVTPPHHEEWRTGMPEARVRFDPQVERWVRERQLFTFVREEADLFGAVFVYSVHDEEALIAWLLGWGTRAELLDPPALRARLADQARAVWARHTDGGEEIGNTARSTDRMLSGALRHA